MTTKSTTDWLVPDWPAPSHIRAVSTTRNGGVSEGHWFGLNLATHVGDDPQHVTANRQFLQDKLGLKNPPQWLTQVHGKHVCDVPHGGECQADAATSTTAGEACVVMTADCLPVLFTDAAGTRVAAAHAGWRGLAGGVLEASLDAFDDPSKVLAWLGPAIGPESFEVGGEVREAFISQDAQAHSAFVQNRPGHWLADIYALARLRLSAAGVENIFGGGLCTYSDAERFYSFRREPITGRMASLIWIQADRG